jgi:hypothetical protein
MELFDARDNGPLPGISDFIPQGRDLSDAEITRIIAAIDDAGLPLPVSLGAGDRWRALVDAVAHREPVEVLPPQEQAMPWLEAHAPPDSTTTVRFEQAASAELAFELKVWGSGLGPGRSVGRSASSESGPRFDCATFITRFRVQTRIYRRRGLPSSQTSEVTVLEPLGTVIESTPREQCRWCSALASGSDEFPFEPSPEDDLDLTRDTAPYSCSLAWTGERNVDIEAGFPVPQLGISLRFKAVARNTQALHFRYELPPGRSYQAYRYPAERERLHSPLWVGTGSGDGSGS